MPTVTVTVTDASGNVSEPASASWTVASTSPLKVIGMSAPASQWSTRLAEVGPNGIKARRIFADLTSNGQHQSNLIGQAVNAGMMPVVSYKVPSVSTLNNGGYASWLNALNTYLGGLGTVVTATFWHEPHGDMTPAEFRAGSQRFLDHLTAPNIKVGPLLNGWLLDNRVADFASYTSPALLAAWDFLGVDTYQAGSMENPDHNKPGGRAVPKLVTWLQGQGFPNMPIAVGEYNGFTAASITYGGEQILATPTVWFGCMWNSVVADGSGLGEVLSGDRLAAFQATKADSRAQQ